jgi:hypothetical protein
MTASVRRSHCHFQTWLRILAARSARGLHERCPSRRGSRGMPDARCTRGLVCKIVQRSAHEHTGSAEAIRHSLRNGFTAYTVLSPATNSSCHRRCRLDGDSNPVGSNSPPTAWHQQRVSGPHGFAVRFGVVRLARRLIAHGKPPCDNAARRRCRVHRIPSRVRDDRDTPLLPGKDGRAGSADLPDRLSGILPVGLFCRSQGAPRWAKARIAAR